MNHLQYVIVGCGRSGTGFLSGFVEASGVRCGHEKVFDVFGPKVTAGAVYESSWYAAPFLKDLPKSAKILHIVRQPEKIIASFYRIGLLSRSPIRHVTRGKPGSFTLKVLRGRLNVRDRINFVREHRQFLSRHTSAFEDDEEISRLVTYWKEWNLLVERNAISSGHRYLRIRLEDVEKKKSDLANFLELPRVPNIRNISRNEKERYAPRPLRTALVMPEDAIALARRYGYEVTSTEPPHLNWSTVMFRKRRTRNGEQAAQARGNSSEAATS